MNIRQDFATGRRTTAEAKPCQHITNIQSRQPGDNKCILLWLPRPKLRFEILQRIYFSIHANTAPIKKSTIIFDTTCKKKYSVRSHETQRKRELVKIFNNLPEKELKKFRLSWFGRSPTSIFEKKINPSQRCALVQFVAVDKINLDISQNKVYYTTLYVKSSSVVLSIIFHCDNFCFNWHMFCFVLQKHIVDIK